MNVATGYDAASRPDFVGAIWRGAATSGAEGRAAGVRGAGGG
jgi:hypothetical protein